MKHALLILTALLSLSACQKKATDTADTANTTETPAEETKADETKTDTKTDSAEQTPAVTKPGPLPAGYTQVPFVTDKPVRTFTAEPEFALADGKDYYALLDTTKGQFLIDLYEQETPVTVNNFVTLARNRFYDGIRFHRVLDGFMAQTGDPTSVDEAKKDQWGSGGPGYQFADEFRTKLSFNSGGILAMANSGPATNGSQIFITFAPTEMLNGRHTIFGKVVKGDDLLPKLTRTATSDPNTGQETPIAGAVPDQILTVRILTKG